MFDFSMASDALLKHCETYGITAVYKETGNIATWYSYFGNEGFYKVSYNTKTGHQTRQRLRYKRAPKFLNGNYNYFCG